MVVVTAPARNYSWPPFQPGHELSVKHGAFTPRKVDPLAGEIATSLLTTGPAFLSQPEYRWALWGLARIEARIQLITEWLDENGTLDPKGVPRPAGDFLLRFERLATDMRARLGLDPSSRVRIERDLASAGRDLNIVAAVQEGQRIRAEVERRQKTEATATDETPGEDPETGDEQ